MYVIKALIAYDKFSFTAKGIPVYADHQLSFRPVYFGSRGMTSYEYFVYPTVEEAKIDLEKIKNVYEEIGYSEIEITEAPTH
jgi:hypothetical protein